MIIHVVAQGETLNSIAARYNVSRKQIIRDNQLRFPDQLVVGQTLVILRRRLVHTVGFGDSLFSIANKYKGTGVLECHETIYTKLVRTKQHVLYS